MAWISELGFTACATVDASLADSDGSRSAALGDPVVGELPLVTLAGAAGTECFFRHDFSLASGVKGGLWVRVKRGGYI
jgi:hypothetical protein